MLQLHAHGFIGDVRKNSIFEWHGVTDSQKRFTENLARHANAEYYSTKKLEYSFNEYGHRSKSVEDIDLNNYILFVGCSHSQGVGNYLEDTFPYIVSSELGMDYYNLSLGGTGLDVQHHNLINWILKFKHPKYLVWQWSHSPRAVTSSTTTHLLQEMGSWSTEKELLNFLLQGDSIGYFDTKRKLVNATLKNLPFETIQIDIKPEPDLLWYEQLDFARDLVHSGPKSNRNISDIIIHEINSRAL